MIQNLAHELLLELHRFLGPLDIRSLRLACHSLKEFPSNVHGQKELEYCIKKGNEPRVRQLLRWPTVHPTTRTLYLAASCGRLEIFELLATPHTDPAAHSNHALRSASANGHVHVVKQLLCMLDRGVDPSANDNQAIRWAAQKGHAAVVRVLMLHPMVDPTANDNHALRWAAREGRFHVVKLLLTHSRVDPAAQNNFALRWASANGHLSVVKLLLAHPRVDCAAEEYQALKWALERKHSAVVAVLLKGGRVTSRVRYKFAPKILRVTIQKLISLF